MADLLDKLGKKTPKTQEGESKPVIGDTPPAMVQSHEDLISQAEVKVDETPQKPETVNDPESWTKDSALKEVLKLREENKQVRVKYREELDKIKDEFAEQKRLIEESAASAKAAQKELQKLQQEEEDKKRSIEEKLAHRESRLTELETIYKQQLEEKDKELKKLAEVVEKANREKDAQMEVYKEKIKKEISKIPEKFRNIAEKLVKSAEDPQEGWLTLKEAIDSEAFSDKKVVVNHSVPGANQGARTTSEQLDNKKEKTSREKIRSGLAALSKNAKALI